MSFSEASSSSSSGTDFGFIDLALAFSTSPSPPTSPSTFSIAASCPLHMQNCKVDDGDALALVQHLVNEHHAKQFDTLFDENGIADIRFDTVIPLVETLARKTAILLSLPSGEILCWSMETKRRGDGELQASSSIQMICRPSPLSRPSSPDNDEGECSSQSVSTAFAQENKETRKTRSTSSSSSSEAAATIENIDESKIQAIYHATITATAAAKTTSSDNNTDGNNSSTRSSPPHQWNGMLSSSRPTCPHEHLVSHRGALVVLYPTNREAFLQCSKQRLDGSPEMCVSLPIGLRLKKISCAQTCHSAIEKCKSRRF